MKFSLQNKSSCPPSPKKEKKMGIHISLNSQAMCQIKTIDGVKVDRYKKIFNVNEAPRRSNNYNGRKN